MSLRSQSIFALSFKLNRVRMLREGIRAARSIGGEAHSQWVQGTTGPIEPVGSP